MATIDDHPLRYALANELHARPFPAVASPCHALFLAIKREQNAAARDRASDRAHLLDLLDRFGAQHPQPDATHYFGDMGRFKLRWESHTEFVTYTVYVDGLPEHAFDPRTFEVFPQDWLDQAPGARITSAMIHVEKAELKDSEIATRLDDWFADESLACSHVLDNSAVIATDFRIDSSGHMRFALFVEPTIGERRVGRILQRLTEIETYKAMSMLGLPRARELQKEMSRIDPKLSTLVATLLSNNKKADHALEELLDIAAELENLQSQSAFRFGATGAYEALVHQRIAVLREERFSGRQTFKEFMMRRYDPAMRTVNSTKQLLTTLIERAGRASDLLRTQVDVARSAQNQKLLESMDRRADLALRLQQTVEGLSVVAISYYAVSLATYLLYPLAAAMDISKGMLTAGVTLPIIGLVWWMVQRIKHSMH